MSGEAGFKRPSGPAEQQAKRARYEAENQIVQHIGGAVATAGFRGESAQQRTSKLQAPIMLLTGHEGEIMTARFSHCGTMFASGGYDQKIFLWNTYGDCENFALLSGHTGTVMDLHFNADASTLVTCATDKTVRIWDMETGACKRKFKSHLEIVNACSPARRGPQLIASASDDGFVMVHDIRQRDPVKKFENRFSQTSVAFSDTAEQVFAGNIENDIVCYDLRKGEVEYTLQNHTDTVTCLSLSPDGSHLLSNSMDNSVLMFDVRSFVEGNRVVGAFRGHEHNFERNLLKCGWSPDGQWVTAGSSDRFVYVWEVDTGRIAYKLPGHQGSVVTTDFSPIEPILLSAGTDKRIYMGEIAPYFRDDAKISFW